MSSRLPSIALIGLALLLAAVVGSGCASGSSSQDPKPAPKPKPISGAPAPVQAVYDQGDALLDPGSGAFATQLDELQGNPVIINKWGSWCGPCREELPVLSDFVQRHGSDVAFLGILSLDSTDAAETFLRDNPISYPSYIDPEESLGNDIVPSGGIPATAFYDTSGKRVYVHQGPYDTVADLEADYEKYLG